jgi:chemotaxis protein methyltransferase CheR
VTTAAPKAAPTSGLDAKLFRRFCELAFEAAGIKLKAGKEALVAGRIARRVRSLGLGSPAEYLRYLEADQNPDEIIEFIDAISTNYTRFNREPDHLEALAARVDALVRQGHRRLRFWSAASSSGEEPYSMAIAIEGALGGRSCDYRILATDISTAVLGRAQEGVYTAEAVAPVGDLARRRFFDPIEVNDKPHFRVKEELRRRIVFRRLNLVRPPYPMQGLFHVILCRNVMIYFERPERQIVVGAIESLLAPGGDFYVGHAESLTGLEHDLEVLRPSCYRKREAPR